MLDKADFIDQKGRLIPDIFLSSIQSRFIPSAARRARGKEPSTFTKRLFVPGLPPRFETAAGDYQSGYRC